MANILTSIADSTYSLSINFLGVHFLIVCLGGAVPTDLAGAQGTATNVANAAATVAQVANAAASTVLDFKEAWSSPSNCFHSK
jgi:hypothetical protein